MTVSFNVNTDNFMNATRIIGHDTISAETPLTLMMIGDNEIKITNAEDVKKYFIEPSAAYGFNVYWFVVMDNQLVDITISETTFTIDGVNTTPKLYQLITASSKQDIVNFISDYNKDSKFNLIKHCYNIDGTSLDIFNSNFFNNEYFYIGTLDIFYTSLTNTSLKLSQLKDVINMFNNGVITSSLYFYKFADINTKHDTDKANIYVSSNCKTFILDNTNDTTALLNNKDLQIVFHQEVVASDGSYFVIDNKLNWDELNDKNKYKNTTLINCLETTEHLQIYDYKPYTLNKYTGESAISKIKYILDSLVFEDVANIVWNVQTGNAIGLQNDLSWGATQLSIRQTDNVLVHRNDNRYFVFYDDVNKQTYYPSTSENNITVNGMNAQEKVRMVELYQNEQSEWLNKNVCYITNSAVPSAGDIFMPFSTIYSSSDDYLNSENDRTEDAVLIDKVCLQSATIPNILLVGSVDDLPETFTQLNTLPNVILSLASIDTKTDTLTIPNNVNNVFVVVDMQTVVSPLHYAYNIKLTDEMPDSVVYSLRSDSNANITINNYSMFTKQTTTQQFMFNEGNYTVNDYVNNNKIHYIADAKRNSSLVVNLFGFANGNLSLLGSLSSIQKNLQTIYNALGQTIIREQVGDITQYSTYCGGMTSNCKQIITDIVKNNVPPIEFPEELDKVSIIKYYSLTLTGESNNIGRVLCTFTLPKHSVVNQTDEDKTIQAIVMLSIIENNATKAYYMYYDKDNKQVIFSSATTAANVDNDTNCLSSYVFEGVDIKQITHNGITNNMVVFNNHVCNIDVENVSDNDDVVYKFVDFENIALVDINREGSQMADPSFS